MGITATLYIPDRIIEGYGLNTEALEKLSINHELIICVDCGTSSHEPIKKLNKETDLIILDHHVGSEQLPDALAIINPNRQDELTNFRYLCAAGVVFFIFSSGNDRPKKPKHKKSRPHSITRFGCISNSCRRSSIDGLKSSLRTTRVKNNKK